MKQEDKQHIPNDNIDAKRVWVRAIVYRMMRAWQVDKIKDLSPFIGCNERTPSNWITNGAVPWDAIYLCHRATGVTLDWLYEGVWPMVADSNQLQTDFKQRINDILVAAKRIGVINENDNHEWLTNKITGEAVNFFTFKQTQPNEGE